MILGRTNAQFAKTWYRPVAGGDPGALAAQLARFEHSVVDVSSQPALWGGLLRCYSGAFLTRSSRDLERAVSESHAADLLEAHLIETLSCLGRPTIDLFCLRIRSRWDEAILQGVFAALESARQDGMVRFVGLAAENEDESRRLYERHDAFEFALVSRGSVTQQMAVDRRAGVIVEVCEEPQPFELYPGVDAHLVTVSEAGDLVLREAG